MFLASPTSSWTSVISNCQGSSTVRLCMQVGKGKMVKVSGIERESRTSTVLLRGSNKLVLEEAERSLHDALCVIRCLVHKRFFIAGGAAPEVEVSTQLQRWAKTLVVGTCTLTIMDAVILSMPSLPNIFCPSTMGSMHYPTAALYRSCCNFGA